MIPLETNQRVLKWFYGFPTDESATRFTKWAYFLFSLSVIITNFVAFITGALFISKFISINLGKAINAVFHTIAAFNMFYQSIMIVVLRRKLTAMFKSLSNIYRENENDGSYLVLLNANETCQWMWPLFIKYILIAFFAIFLMTSVVSVAICYIMLGYFNVNYAYHPLFLILPWNQTTLLGYSVEMCFVLYATDIYLFTNGTITVLFISLCLHHRTFYKMFQDKAQILEYRDDTRNDADHLRKLICFHISVKDWFHETADVFSAFIMIVLISSMLYLASIVFQLDLQMRHPDFGMITIFLAVPLGTSLLFVYCYLGKMSTESYLKMSDCLYECNWLNLPYKLQKYLIIMIENAQRPIYYHGFEVAVLNLETFSKMIRTVISYYMIFKTLVTD